MLHVIYMISWGFWTNIINILNHQFALLVPFLGRLSFSLFFLSSEFILFQCSEQNKFYFSLLEDKLNYEDVI